MAPSAAPFGPSRLAGLARKAALPAVLSLAGGLLAGWVLNRVLDDALAGRTEASAFSLLARVGPDVESVLAAGGDVPGTIERLGRQLSLRATLVAPDGRVVGDSAVDRARLASLESHANRPEILDALRDGRGVRTRFSATLGERLVYAAIRLRSGEVLRLAFPEKELSRWEAPYRRRTLALSSLAGLLVAALLVRSRLRHAFELRLVRSAVAAADRGERLATRADVSEEAALVLAALGDLADGAAAREARARRGAAVARAVFDGAPVGVLFVDAGLSLVDANPAALRLLGASREQARPGEHVLELVREKELVALLEAALADGRSTATLRVARDGGSSALAAEAFRVGGDASGAEAVLVAVLRETPSPHAV